MNIREFKSVVPVLLKHKIVPFVWGSQGVGKTQVVKQICKEQGLDIRVLHCATQEVGDLIGLLVKSEDGESVHHARPRWFPTEGKGIVFLDELNRAPMDVLQSLFSFILDGTLHTHKLPPGWVVVAAGNYDSERFSTTQVGDAAWLSRFCHLDFTPTVEEFITYVEDKDMHDVADFIREQPSMLELDAKTAGRLDSSFIVPDRRSWEGMLGVLDNDSSLPENLRYEVYSGIVGSTGAAAFITFKTKREKAFTLNHIIKGYKTKVAPKIKELMLNQKEARFDVLNGPIDELITRLESKPDFLKNSEYIENVKEYLFDIPKELAMKTFTRMQAIPNFAGKNAILNDVEYVNRFRRNKETK